MSVCEIDTAETYEKGRPKRGGLSDPRMGTMDRAMACETDGMNSTDTPGYFGHLELAKPVFHHGFIKNVVSVLRCVGFSSSKLMIDKVRAGQRHTRWSIFTSRPTCFRLVPIGFLSPRIARAITAEARLPGDVSGPRGSTRDPRDPSAMFAARECP